jgi:hypothetical protein
MIFNTLIANGLNDVDFSSMLRLTICQLASLHLSLIL